MKTHKRFNIKIGGFIWGKNDKVLIINGSPRKNKNCSSIIKEITKKKI